MPENNIYIYRNHRWLKVILLITAAAYIVWRIAQIPLDSTY